MDLATTYMGIQLKNPLVASASPLNKELDTVRCLEDSGAAAVVLPSMFEEQIEQERLRFDSLTSVGAESVAEASSYFPNLSSYNAGPEGYLEIVRRTSEAVDIPIVASLNGTTDEGWYQYATLLQEAGAQALELNVFYIPTDARITGRAVEQRYVDVLKAVKGAVSIPVAVKLGPYFSAMANMAQELDAAGANGLVLFNRFYQPDVDLSELRVLNDLELSRASEIRLPLLWIAVLYGRVTASLGASTGVEAVDEVVKYLLAGADVVMTTSALLRNGVGYIGTLLEDLKSWLAKREIASVDAIRGMLSQQRAPTPEAFERANYMQILRAFPASRQ